MTKPLVAICIPTMRGVSPRIQDAINHLIEHSESKGVECEVFIEQGSLVHVARNNLIKKVRATNRPFTHVLMVDDDNLPPADALVKLLGHNVGVASGLYVTRCENPSPVAWVLSPLGDAEPVSQWQRGEVMEVEWTGGGFLLIRFDVLRAVAEAYINCEWEYQIFGDFPMSKHFTAERVRRFKHDGEIEWFRFLPTPGGTTFGEDASFCCQARALGFPTLLDTGVEVGHLGEKVYYPADMQRTSSPLTDETLVTIPEDNEGLWHRINIYTAEVETLEFLASLVNLLKPQLVVETGSYEGWSALYMARALRRNGRGKLVTLELNHDLWNKTVSKVGDLFDEWVQPVCGSSLEFTPTAPIDLLFIDSAIEIRMQEIDHFKPWLHKDSLVVVHDTRNSDLGELLAKRGDLVVLDLPTPRGVAILKLK
jgi:predicted O-methyltransferase YrrM